MCIGATGKAPRTTGVMKADSAPALATSFTNSNSMISPSSSERRRASSRVGLADIGGIAGGSTISSRVTGSKPGAEDGAVVPHGRRGDDARQGRERPVAVAGQDVQTSWGGSTATQFRVRESSRYQLARHSFAHVGLLDAHQLGHRGLPAVKGVDFLQDRPDQRVRALEELDACVDQRVLGFRRGRRQLPTFIVGRPSMLTVVPPRPCRGSR